MSQTTKIGIFINKKTYFPPRPGIWNGTIEIRNRKFNFKEFPAFKTLVQHVRQRKSNLKPQSSKIIKKEIDRLNVVISQK